MIPTPQQIQIINSVGDASINAVAGSGKTSTLIAFAAAQSKDKKLLYLAFNRSVKLEAKNKFAAEGLHNVKVETAHSLAYQHIVHHYHYQLKAQGYKTHELVELLGLEGNGEKHTEYIIANHISRFILYFCNSDKAKVQDLNYLDTVTDPKAKRFVTTFYHYIEKSTRLLLGKMDKGEISISHDFYLKKFQLSKPKLHYDFILFDEGQDASAAMLEVFLQQQATKVIVGDIHQQIYGWRYAVNSLGKTNFQSFQLSASFRFPQAIADLAAEFLKWKKHIGTYSEITITGSGNSDAEVTKATIARTNLGLLLNAINFTTDNPKVKHIYFEGNINSYTYADDGASLYDVLNLYNNSFHLIRDKLIRSMANLADLEEYIEKTEDVQLGMMVEIVKEYGNEIPRIIKSLKGLHTGDEDRSKAEMIFSTVHRAKGMEYDVVYLVNDFIKEEGLEKSAFGKKESKPDPAKLNEEINLLYVAVTRTKNKLHLPESLMPKSFPASPYITIIPAQAIEDDLDVATGSLDNGELFSKKNSRLKFPPHLKEKSYSLEEKRLQHKDAYKPWTPALDNELRTLYESDNPVSALAAHFGRTKGAILSRLKKLNYFE